MFGGRVTPHSTPELPELSCCLREKETFHRENMKRKLQIVVDTIAASLLGFSSSNKFIVVPKRTLRRIAGQHQNANYETQS